MKYPIDLFFFFLRIQYILKHIHSKMGEDLKKTDSDVYLKQPNSWIHSICFKSL